MLSELEHHARLLRYDSWANAEAASSLSRDTAPPQAVRWMAHIVGCELLWLSRLAQEPPRMAVWPELDAEASAARVRELADEWPRYLSSLSEEDLSDGIAYRNSKGEFWTSTVADILTHVVTHSAYHRGQIAAAVRAAGGEPAYTDYIHAVRQELIE
jgi:uncharacterized damage-inducible protein DinB